MSFGNVDFHNVPFQLKALKLHFPDDNIITICSLYKQLNRNDDLANLSHVLDLLTQPFLLLGDFMLTLLCGITVVYRLTLLIYK